MLDHLSYSEKLAYVSGFFDGEGSVGIYKDSWRKDRKGNLRPSRGSGVRVVLQAAGYVKEPLLLFEELFHGRISSGSVSSTGHPVHYFRINKQEDVEAALTALLPNLLVKREQVELALRFMLWRRSASHVLSNEETIVAEKFELELKRLKREVLPK